MGKKQATAAVKAKRPDAKIVTGVAKIVGKNLVITLPLQRPRPSKTGKTLLVAGSGGIIMTDAKVNGEAIKIGVNAFIQPDDLKSAKGKAVQSNDDEDDEEPDMDDE